MHSFSLSDAAPIAESPGIHLKKNGCGFWQIPLCKKQSRVNDCGAGTVFFVVARLRGVRYAGIHQKIKSKVKGADRQDKNL
jgi:hypothetical protein